MSKKNRKKHHRSKASKKRRAACEANPDLKRVSFVGASEIHNHKQLNEMAHSFRVCDLGTMEEPGLVSLSLASYIGSLRKRLMNGENVKENVFLQIGYSHFSVSQWMRKRVMHASGGTNIPTMDLVIPDSEDSKALILKIEQSIRDTVAQLNESSEDNIRTVHLAIDECRKEKDPTGAFGVPKDIIDPDGHLEQRISYSY